MFMLFFICWIVFNQAFTLEIAIFGIVICSAVYLFCCKFMGFSVKKDLFIVKKIPRIFQYVFVLIKEVIKANITLVKLFFVKREKKEPVIVTFKTSLKTDFARALLANAITLTPGTITMSLESDRYTVHCYDKSLASGLNNTVFEELLLKMEGGYEA